MMRTVLGLVLCMAFRLFAGGAPDRIRTAASKAIALMQASQKTWHAKQSCYSCHQQALTALALEAAREHGIPYNEELAHSTAAEDFAFLTRLDQAVQFTNAIDPGMTESYILSGTQGRRPAQPEHGHLCADDRGPAETRWPLGHAGRSTAAILQHGHGDRKRHSAVLIYGHPSLAADTKASTDRARRIAPKNEPCSYSASIGRVQVSISSIISPPISKPRNGRMVDGIRSTAGQAIPNRRVKCWLPCTEPAAFPRLILPGSAACD